MTIEAYRALAKVLARDPRVTEPGEKRGRFGSNGIKVDGKTFAMIVDGALVVKLPTGEVDAAVVEGRGERFIMGAGRVMKEWLVVHEPPSRWKPLALRARNFVGGDEEG